MPDDNVVPVYDSISQRAVDTYRRALVLFDSTAIDARTESRRQLHDFFAALYDLMYEDPAQFGMSTAADDFLENDTHGGDHSSAILRKLNQQRNKITATTELLRSAGESGRLEDDSLRIPVTKYREMVARTPKVLAKCLAGLAEIGLLVVERDGDVVVGNSRFPKMMAALSELARAQKARRRSKLGHMCFARCDFNSLDADYEPGVEGLFSYFDPGTRDQATALHEFMLETGHTAGFAHGKIHEWELDFQGPRKIKSTQLVRIRYDDRDRDSGLVYVLCAASARLVPYFDEQPEPVQDDFRERIHECDPNCNWCEDRKGLGPAELEGRTICWFTSNRPHAIDDESMQLVRDYVRWHGALA